MRRITLLTLCAVMLLLPIVLQAADWPRFGGPSGNATSPERGINKDWTKKPPKMLWQTSLTDGGYAGPSVSGGKVFIIDHMEDKDVVRAIDIKTGKDVWKYSYVDAEKENYGFSRSTPAVDGGNVYTLGRMGVVNCLDTKTGKLKWSRNIMTEYKGVRPNWNYAMSPFVDGGKVILIPGGPDATVVAFDKITGKTIWQGGGSDEPGYCTPQKVNINGTPQYLIFSANTLMGLNPGSGAVLWNFNWKTRSGVNAAIPIVMGNEIFITASYGHGCALVKVNPTETKSLWENKEMLAHFSSPVKVGSYIYGVGDPGKLICLDPATGTPKWTQDGFEKGPMMGIDGVLLVFDGKNGDLVMVNPNPDKYEELGRFTPLGGQSWTAPIASNGKMIVRNKTTLACFDLK